MTDERRLRELARRAARDCGPAFSHFLEPDQPPVAQRCAREEGVEVAFSGGYPGAERMIAAFTAGADAPDFPITCLSIRWDQRYSAAGHRDILGAVMGLGIDREATGDIVLLDGEACLFAEREIARYIRDNLASAGRARLTVAPREAEFEPPEPAGTLSRVTFSSPRLDALVAAGYDLSRAEAQKMVAQGLVKLNHAPCERGDREVREGDLISARGLGRLRVERMLGETRRGRLAAQLFRYGK